MEVVSALLPEYIPELSYLVTKILENLYVGERNVAEHSVRRVKYPVHNGTLHVHSEAVREISLLPSPFEPRVIAGIIELATKASRSQVTRTYYQFVVQIEIAMKESHTQSSLLNPRRWRLLPH